MIKQCFVVLMVTFFPYLYNATPKHRNVHLCENKANTVHQIKTQRHMKNQSKSNFLIALHKTLFKYDNAETTTPNQQIFIVNHVPHGLYMKIMGKRRFWQRNGNVDLELG